LRIQVELSSFEGDTAALERTVFSRYEKPPGFEPNSTFSGFSPWNETQHLAQLTWIQTQIILASLESRPLLKLELQSYLDYLDQRIQAAQQRGIRFRVIECSVLKSLVLDALGNNKRALVPLSQALSQALSLTLISLDCQYILELMTNF